MFLKMVEERPTIGPTILGGGKEGDYVTSNTSLLHWLQLLTRGHPTVCST